MNPYQQRRGARMNWRRYGPLDVVMDGGYARLEITLRFFGRYLSLFVHSVRATVELEAWSCGDVRPWPLSAKVKVGRYL